jgi:hypothetical protein
MTKTLNQIFFFLHQNQNIFFSAKNHNPPFKLNGRSLSSFREENFSRNQPIRSKNCLWWPCLLTDQDEIGNLYRGPAIDASYQVWFFASFRIFFSDNTRVSIFFFCRAKREFFFRNSTLGYMTKTMNQIFFNGSGRNRQSL